MRKAPKLFPTIQERAVRLVLEHPNNHGSQWAASGSIAGKIGCTSETLRRRVRQAEHDPGERPGPTTSETERFKALERENRQLRQANESLRKAGAQKPSRNLTACPNCSGCRARFT